MTCDRSCPRCSESLRIVVRPSPFGPFVLGVCSCGVVVGGYDGPGKSEALEAFRHAGAGVREASP